MIYNMQATAVILCLTRVTPAINALFGAQNVRHNYPDIGIRGRLLRRAISLLVDSLSAPPST